MGFKSFIDRLMQALAAGQDDAATIKDAAAPAEEAAAGSASHDDAAIVDGGEGAAASASEDEEPKAIASDDAGTVPANGMTMSATATPLDSTDASLAPAGEPDGQEAPSVPTSHLDYDGFAENLVETDDPIAELKLFVGDIRTREAATRPHAHGDREAMPSPALSLAASEADEAGSPTDQPAPSGLELFAARQLEEAGLFSSDVEMPPIKVVIPRLSQMLYLRTSGSMSYLAKLRVLKLEAALNSIRFAHNYFEADAPDDADGEPDAGAAADAVPDGQPSPSLEDCYRMLQNLTTSICAQEPPMSVPMPVQDDDVRDGEWAVRRGISTAIEGFTLPYRLSADFRCNVADGNVAIRIDLMPEQVFPSSVYVEGIGVVASSREMRHKAASAYALRVALLVANAAFRTSEKIKHVWVQETLDTANRHACYLCVDFDRWRFARLDLQHADDLARIYRSFVPQMRWEDGILKPVAATFSLDEERFCPSRRYIPVSLSRRKLSGRIAEALGTDHVSGLAIEEADKRSLLSADILRGLAAPDAKDATEQDIRAILEVAGNDPDPSVREAGERTAKKLIDGTLPDDPLAVVDEFVSGDALSRATREANDLLSHQDEQDAAEAARVLEKALAPIEASGLYGDSGLVQYRYFASYLDRALYNRLYAKGRSVMLVPDAYFDAEILLSTSRMATGDGEGALDAARKAQQMAPLDMRASLQVVRALERLDRADEAMAELKRLLTIAHDPQTLALAYYRLAFFEWHEGKLLAAQACYQCAMRFMPAQMMPQASMELAALAIQNPGTYKPDITSEQIVQILKDHDIPVAPTEQVTKAFYDATRASLDAEIFPVARNFVNVLGAFTGDDVIFGIIRSIEDEPDR